MSADLIFEDPPINGKGRNSQGQSAFGQWLNALRDHPGQWAKYPVIRSSSDAAHIRMGRYGAKRGEFEARTVTANQAGRAWIYARYIGGQS